jgi:hypothetical protein
MRMPGFAAEASLSQTSGHDKVAVVWAEGSGGQVVTPQ